MGQRIVRWLETKLEGELVLTVNHASGAGYYAMAGQGFDPDFILSWPTGRMAVMEGESAVMAVHGPAIQKAQQERRPLDEATATAIYQLDEHWNGKGHPQGLKGEQISLLARIMGLAQTLEVFFSQQGLLAAMDIAEDRRGRWFDPDLVDAFLATRDGFDFWRRVHHPNPHQQVAAFEPSDAALIADEPQLDAIAAAFAQVVDAKSPWTYKHSAGVAEIAVGIGQNWAAVRAAL